MSPVFHRESSYTFKIFSNEELRMHIHVFRDDFEAVCILICFPLIVAIGAGSSVTGSKSSAINKFLGEISYPIYITHYPRDGYYESSIGGPENILIEITI